MTKNFKIHPVVQKVLGKTTNRRQKLAAGIKILLKISFKNPNEPKETTFASTNNAENSVGCTRRKMDV